MTKIFRSSFYRTKQADPLDEEAEEPLAASAGEYKDLEDGSGANGSDEKAGSCGGDERALCMGLTVALSFLAIYYLVIGSFYVWPEDGADAADMVTGIMGGVSLGLAGPVLAIAIGVFCFPTVHVDLNS